MSLAGANGLMVSVAYPQMQRFYDVAMSLLWVAIAF